MKSLARTLALLFLWALPACHCGAPEGVLDQCQSDLALPPSVSTDILFVIDNSGSMSLKQKKVQQQLGNFVAQLVNAPVRNDFQMGVVTTGVTENYELCGTGQQPTCLSFDAESGRLQRGKDLNGDVINPADKTILAPADPDFLTVAQRAIGQGIMGSGEEMGLQAARLAVSAPLIDTPTTGSPPGNQGFLRPGARLLVIIVSDEDDCSDAHDCSSPGSRLAIQGACGDVCTADSQCPGEADYCLYIQPTDPSQGRRCSPNACETVAGRAELQPVPDYISFLNGMDDGTGSGRKRQTFLAVIGAVDSSLTPARCTGNGDEAYGIAQRYKDAVTQMGEYGLIDSICKDDYGDTLTRIAALVNAPQTVDLAEAPPDPHLIFFEVTRTTGEVTTCKVGDGFDYDPPVVSDGGTAPARVTFKGTCHLNPGDKLKQRVMCAG